MSTLFRARVNQEENIDHKASSSLQNSYTTPPEACQLIRQPKPAYVQEPKETMAKQLLNKCAHCYTFCSSKDKIIHCCNNVCKNFFHLSCTYTDSDLDRYSCSRICFEYYDYKLKVNNVMPTPSAVSASKPM